MQRILLFALLTFAAFSSRADNKLLINHPHDPWKPVTGGNITDVSLDIFPNGLYVQHELTMTLNAPGQFAPTDSLEAVLTFDLPANSFIHDSWLWLDNTTIIRADIIERGKATNIYEGIVKRRRDPSLLVKNGPDNYQLNVYPMTVNYPRKVKITYSTPLIWNGDKTIFTLPASILRSSVVRPDLSVKLHSNSVFQQPGCINYDMNTLQTGSGGGVVTLSVPPAKYVNTEAPILYFSNPMSNGAWLAAHTPAAGEGVYELAVDPAQVTGNAVSRKLVLILDHPMTGAYYSVYSLAEAKSMLKELLYTRFRDIDSFNVFYVDNGTVQQAFSDWTVVDPVHIATAVDAISNAASSGQVQMENLLKTALAFSQTRSSTHTQAILLSNNSNFPGGAPVDTIVSRVKNHLGSFKNKLHVINYIGFDSWFGGSPVRGSEMLFRSLTQATGGNYYQYADRKYVRVGNTYIYLFGLDGERILSDLAWGMGTTTNMYNINLPLSAGFTYSTFPLNGISRFSNAGVYTETGRYYGSLGNGNIDVQVALGGNLVSQQLPVSVVPATGHAMKGWVFAYINSLAAMGNTFNAEIIDSSINNRVLCDLTAFLALEDGDTINAITNKDDNGNNPVSVPQVPGAQEWVKIFPNPFAERLQFSFSVPADRIDIYDMQGRTVLSVLLNKATSFTWDGRDGQGRSLAAGIYLIKVRAGERSLTLKAQKQQ